MNPEEIVVPGKPRVYDGKQGDVTFQIQCHCRNKNCAFAGYTLPPCMAARKTTSAIRGRSMNRNPIDLFKYVPGSFSDLLTNRMYHTSCMDCWILHRYWMLDRVSNKLKTIKS